MKIQFADTGYWIAILNPSDSLHSKAMTIAEILETKRYFIVTSEFVLIELLDHFADASPSIRSSVAKYVEQLSEDARITIIAATSDQFRAAREFYAKMDDKKWSMTDCTSFLIMREHQITEALTYDKHFVQAGFKALLRNE